MKKNRGFTLIEMLIVMVVIGILAAIAIPSYQNQLRKGSRAAAQAAMMDLANKEVFYLQSNRAYTSDYANDLKVVLPDDVQRFYTVTITPDNTTTPPSFVIKAAPKSGTRQAGDPDLTLNEKGDKVPADKW